MKIAFRQTLVILKDDHQERKKKETRTKFSYSPSNENLTNLMPILCLQQERLDFFFLKLHLSR